nr:helix-turn-helix transcriptional regulator [Panacagrimonas sp.]
MQLPLFLKTSMNRHLESSLCSRCRVQLLSSRDAATLEVPDVASAARLTRSERAVFQLLCTGLANKQIAERLGISENTVRYHLKQVYAKLGVRSRSHAVARVGGSTPEVAASA